jgi:hypothetical protein
MVNGQKEKKRKGEWAKNSLGKETTLEQALGRVPAQPQEHE